MSKTAIIPFHINLIIIITNTEAYLRKISHKILNVSKKLSISKNRGRYNLSLNFRCFKHIKSGSYQKNLYRFFVK